MILGSGVLMMNGRRLGLVSGAVYSRIPRLRNLSVAGSADMMVEDGVETRLTGALTSWTEEALTVLGHVPEAEERADLCWMGQMADDVKKLWIRSAVSSGVTVETDDDGAARVRFAVVGVE